MRWHRTTFIGRLFWTALWGILAVDCTVATADPETLHPDIRIRKILAVAKNTVRLVKDPRDHTLYTMTIECAISRIDLAEYATASEVIYTTADHGMDSMVQGFAIGPDGTFYITSNTPGKVSHQLDAIVRGRWIRPCAFCPMCRSTKSPSG